MDILEMSFGICEWPGVTLSLPAEVWGIAGQSEGLLQAARFLPLFHYLTATLFYTIDGGCHGIQDKWKYGRKKVDKMGGTGVLTRAAESIL